MAIQNRRGNADDFDPGKMLSGEFGYVLTDSVTYKKGLYYCYAPGDVRRLTTAEDVMVILNSSQEAYTALQQLITDLDTNPDELTSILANISNLQTNVSNLQTNVSNLQTNVSNLQTNVSNLQTDKLDKTGDSKDNIATFTEAEIEEDIVTGETHTTIFGKILKSLKTFRTSILDKIDKSSIIHTTETNDVTKVPSSTVTHGLGQQVITLENDVDTINNNFNSKFLHGLFSCSSENSIEIPVTLNKMYRLDLCTFVDVPSSSSSYLLIGNVYIDTVSEGSSPHAPIATMQSGENVAVALKSDAVSRDVHYMLTKIS